MSQVRRKYDLPDIAKIPNVKFDIKKLEGELKRLENFWSSVFEANYGLVALNKKLARDVYAGFDQIALTWYEALTEEQSLKGLSKGGIIKRGMLSIAPATSPDEKRLKTNASSAEAYRQKTKGRGQLPKAMNEHNWHHPMPYYKNSYIQTALSNMFKSRPIRVRLTRLKKGKTVVPHIDYCPSYAVRILVPIQGAEGVINTVERRGKINSYHLKADGSAWFINVGFKHSVLHKGEKDRIALMFSLSDQQDLKGIKSLKAADPL